MLGNSAISRRFDAIMVRVAPFAAAASAGLILWHAARDKPAAVGALPVPLIYPNSPATHSPPTPSDGSQSTDPAGSIAPQAAQQAGVAATIEVIVGRNDTMDAIFRRMALDKADLAAIRNLPGIRQSMDFLKPGDAIKVTHLHDGAIQELSRKVSETQTLEVTRGDLGFAAKMISNPVETHIRTAAATIETSLFQAAETASVSDATALKVANVFGWDIDFVLDLRQGDRFKAVYEQIYQDGKYMRDGDLLAAEFVNGGKVYRAVRFVAEDGSVGYYTPEGKPMRKAFLRAPVDFTRISSGFNPARLHPILNLIRGHMGTDYAAPTGTPVHAAGDGRVSFEGTRGGYGNAILLSHSAGISTLYGHMSRFAKGIHVGSHVNQAEIIGYVGMTGLATGPHLHYEYLMNGVHMDPQTVRLPGAEPLRADALAKFRSTAAPLVGRLSSSPSASPANAASASSARPSSASLSSASLSSASLSSASPSNVAPSDASLSNASLSNASLSNAAPSNAAPSNAAPSNAAPSSVAASRSPVAGETLSPVTSSVAATAVSVATVGGADDDWAVN